MAYRPALVITVGTEADDEWDHNRLRSYTNVATMASFQELCDRHRAKPTYLVTYDVASQPDCAQVLRQVTAKGQAEIGAHLHPWSTAPFHGDEPVGRHAYWYEYAPPEQRAKIEKLTERLAAVFGRRPTSFRAGRWGLDAAGMELLGSLGYTVDTSVVPLTSFRRNLGRSVGGPDYSRFPVAPYYPDAEDMARPGASSLLEVPVSVGVIGPWGKRLAGLLRTGMGAADYVKRGLRKAGLARRVALQPVHEPSDLMIRLVDTLIAQGVPVLNVALHSSEWEVGFSPSIASEAGGQQQYARSSDFLEDLGPPWRVWGSPSSPHAGATGRHWIGASAPADELH